MLLDTNIIIDVQNEVSPFCQAAESMIVAAVQETGAAINAVCFAELCAGRPDASAAIEAELSTLGIQILDVPAAAAPICGRAYSQYRKERRRAGGGNAPATPLPDFFIGAHAELLGWKLATRDSDRYRIYFPAVELIEP